MVMKGRVMEGRRPKGGRVTPEISGSFGRGPVTFALTAQETNWMPRGRSII
jgi:hypothetical protein